MKRANLIIILGIPCLLVAFNNCSSPYTSASHEGSSKPSEDLIPEGLSELDFFQLGKTQYLQACAGCHGSLENSNKRNTSEIAIQNALLAVSSMKNALSDKTDLNYQAIVYALNNSQPVPEDAIPNSDPTQVFACNTPNQRGMNHYTARRMTQIELKNTIRDLFGESVVLGAVSALGLYPEDKFVDSISEFNPNLDPLLAEALLAISVDVGKFAILNSTDRTRNLPSCMLNQYGNIDLTDSACRDNFVKDLGLKVLRRPLTETQFQSFSQILTSENEIFEFNRDRISALISAMMMTPEFTHHIAFFESEDTDRAHLDSYSVASRISYSSAGTTPDAALLDSAAAKKLSTLADRKPHAQRLLNSKSGQTYILAVFNEYLRLDHIQAIPSSNYGKFLNVNPENLVSDLKKETLSFVEHHVSNPKTSYYDLMTSNKAFPINSNSAKILESEVSLGANDPKTSSSGHLGLYLRPIFLISSSNRTSPISRGIKINRNVLCESIPDPDPELIAKAEEELGDIDETISTSRQVAEHKTSGTSCQVCHKYINPPGYILENFGPFAERRSKEAVFDGQGNLLRELEIDSTVDGLLIDKSSTTVTSSEEFIQSVATSSQGMACFTENMFKYLNLRENNSEDGCQMAEMESLLKKGFSIQDFLIQNAISEDQLWQKTN